MQGLRLVAAASLDPCAIRRGMRLAFVPDMVKTNTLDPGSSSIADSRSSADPIVGRRIGMATVLTALALAIGIGVGIAFGPTGALLFALPLPVPVVLLWLSSDVVRADERKGSRQ